MPYEPLRFFEKDELALARRPTGEIAVQVAGVWHENLKAYATHPITDSHRYISLRGTPPEGKEAELGIVRDLSELSDTNRVLVEEALARRYRMHTIQTIVSVKEDFGYLCWN